MKKAPAGVVVGEGVGSGYVFEGKRRNKKELDTRL